MSEKDQNICSDEIKTQGQIEITVTNVETNEVVHYEKKNTVLTVGKSTLARLVTDDFSSPVYIQNIIFGQGGEDGNVPKTVDPGRNSLFNFISGAQVTAAKGWSSDYPTRATFSATLGAGTANGSVVNEAALELNNGDLFSMVTFFGLTKTSSFAFTLNWTLIFI